jgi:hypothetical protein
LVFVQFFDDLQGFEGVMNMIPQSSAYLRVDQLRPPDKTDVRCVSINVGFFQPYVPNVVLKF